MHTSSLRLSRYLRHVLCHLSMLSALGLAACTDFADTAQLPAVGGDQVVVANLHRLPPGKGTAVARQHCVGGYFADRVSGDFAGYLNLQLFIEKMVSQHGFDRAYLQGLFSQAKRKDWTLNYFAKIDKSLKKQPRQGSWTRYRAKFLDERRIKDGAEFAQRYQSALLRATRVYGVPEEYIIGIIAVETNFGKNLGSHRIIDALTTLGFDYARRGAFFRDELEEFLLMARSEGIDPARPKGSFAGAMGLGQFMPSSFRKWAVDFNGDGHRDLWNPEDAIGSIANYFAQHGWQPGRPVVTPLVAQGPVHLEAGFDTKYAPRRLYQLGLKPVRPCQDREIVSLLQLRHLKFDQYFIGHPNFYTITRYNHSTHYAMAVYELAQAIKHRL